MINAVAEQAEEVERLCKRFNVQRLELFGSATQGAFDPSRSDLDFIVDFRPAALDNYADTYFGLLEALEDLFGRAVDLVVHSTIKNPYFLKAIEETRTAVYEA